MECTVLFEELSSSAEMIRAMLAGIPEAQARVRPAPDSWSVLEVVCHLHDEEREDFRPRLDMILHRAEEDLRPIDPQGWVAQRRYNEQDLEAMQAAFLAEREKSLAWLSSLRRADWGKTYRSESLTISAGQMLAAWVAHDNLHVRQLVELRRNLIERLAAPFELEYAGAW
jgi:hypothetical protein